MGVQANEATQDVTKLSEICGDSCEDLIAWINAKATDKTSSESFHPANALKPLYDIGLTTVQNVCS